MTCDSISRAKEAIARCVALARFSEDSGGTRRTFLSPPTRDCHTQISAWLEPLGVSVTIDAAGNLRGFYPGADPQAGRVLIGSHLDTVPNAGKYDGILGVVLGVGLIEALEGRQLPFGIELVGFSDEEGVRFGVPFIGSRALVGRLDEDLLSRQDSQGVSVRQAIRNFGLNDAHIPQAVLSDDVLCYLEFHIEQGPVLEDLGRPLAVVDAIAGQNRLEFTFGGRSNHAGTTPMHLRHDALAGAAEWIVAVENEGRRAPNLVATVGAIEAKPGATNAIAGEVRVTLDVRHASDDIREQVVRNLVRAAEEIVQRRGLSLTHAILLNQRAVLMTPFLMDQIEQAMREAGCDPYSPSRMTSGAGHDAMILAEKVPAAMIFLRTPGGVSHDPAETVQTEDVARALECGLHLLNRFATRPILQTRTFRA